MRFRLIDLGAAVAVLAGLLLVAAIVRKRLGSAPLTLTGQAYVVDGDSLRLAGSAVRLRGIDAPELAQRCGSRLWPCGEVARAHLRELIEGHAVICRERGRDRYRRVLAECEAGGRSLNAAMVRDGHAVGYRAYRAEEADARDAGRGLWSGPFERPEAWRRGQGAAAQ